MKDTLLTKLAIVLLLCLSLSFLGCKKETENIIDKDKKLNDTNKLQPIAGKLMGFNENINPAEQKEQFIGLLRNAGPNQIVDLFSGVVLSYHKAGDTHGKYRMLFLSGPREALSKTYYMISAWTDNPDMITDSKVYLSSRDGTQQYIIELSPAQEREIFNKILEVGFFECDSMMSNRILGYHNREKPISYVKTPHRELYKIDYVALSAMDISCIDETPKNKAAIDAFATFLKTKYDAELKAHPAPNNCFPWQTVIPAEYLK